MSKKREFGEGPIFTITNYLWWFFLANVYFVICSAFLIITCIAYQFSYDNILVFVLPCILEGPALTALFSVMGKLVREKDLDVTKNFFKAYKLNFIQSIIISAIQVIIATILIIDIRFLKVTAYGPFILPIIYILFVLNIVLAFYTFPIISRFYLKTMDIFKVGFFYSVRKFPITLSNISILILSFIIMYYLPFSILFITSLIAYGIMFNEKKIIQELEEKIKPQ